MTLKPPNWMQLGTYSATIDREVLDTLFAAAGVVNVTDLAVIQRGAGANMSVDVPAGECVVTGTDLAGQGKYLCKSDATVNVVIATAPGTGQSRIDLIVATVRDQDQNGLAHNDWIIQAVTGTAAATGSQVAPAVPASSLLLAQIAVGPNVTTILTANIADKRVLVNLIGPQRGNPAGDATGTGNASVTSGSAVTINMASNFVKGGTTFGSNGYTVPVAGGYAVSAMAAWNPANAGLCQIVILKNGIAVPGAVSNFSALAGGWVTPSVSKDILCAAGDLITVQTTQFTGAAVSLLSGNSSLSVDLVSV